MSAVPAPATRNWDVVLESWGQPLSAAQDEKCKRALDGIEKAVAKSDWLKSISATVSIQGSYKNGTSVKFESDVDAYALTPHYYLVQYPPGVTNETVGLSSSSYTYAKYRNDIGAALINHFGAPNVTRGDKAFDVHENTYRVDADVVACFEYREYFRASTGALHFNRGTALIADSDGRVRSNFPEQQCSNVNWKDGLTKGRFRQIVRIIKRLRNEMDENNFPSAKLMASFLIESLIWNLPNEKFSGPLRQAVKGVLLEIWSLSRTDSACAHWMEANNVKRLFGIHQKWTRDQVNAFALAAWSYIPAP